MKQIKIVLGFVLMLTIGNSYAGCGSASLGGCTYTPNAGGGGYMECVCSNSNMGSWCNWLKSGGCERLGGTSSNVCVAGGDGYACEWVW